MAAMSQSQLKRPSASVHPNLNPNDGCNDGASVPSFLDALEQPAKRGRRGPTPGGQEFLAMTAEWRPGPRSVVDMINCCPRLVSDILQADVSEMCLAANLAKGCILASDHSGTGNGETGALMALRALGPRLCPEGQPQVLSACDPANAALHCLRSGEALRIFADLSEQVPAAGREMLDALQPEASASRKERMLGYEAMYKDMLANLDTILPTDRTMKDLRSGEFQPAFEPCFPGSEFKHPLSHGSVAPNAMHSAPWANRSGLRT